MKRMVSALCVFLLAASVSTASAAPIQYLGNGHFYEAVINPTGGMLSWTAARTHAESQWLAFGGSNYQGHLATISSLGESTFIESLPNFNSAFPPPPNFGTGDVGPWIGAYRGAGGWYWIDKPGSPFCDLNGNPIAGAFVDWIRVSGQWEPNGGSGEPYAGFFNRTANPAVVGWDDRPLAGFNAANSYIIEFDTPLAGAPIPEPASLLLVGSGLVAALGRIGSRRRKK